ncbi:NapC/NirT family cytochrome c [bacterium]|nr:NapC/NirT family cytochrome c [bacterium]
MARLPGRRFWLAVGVVGIAAFFGLNAYSQRSQFCGSCHSVMGEHYDSWQSSTHGETAECLDCHSEPGWTGYYHSKVEGVRNALQFYLGIEKPGKAPAPGPAACLRPGCHEETLLEESPEQGGFAHSGHLERVACVECHGDIGHGEAERERAVSCAECHGDSEQDVVE